MRCEANKLSVRRQDHELAADDTPAAVVNVDHPLIDFDRIGNSRKCIASILSEAGLKVISHLENVKRVGFNFDATKADGCAHLSDHRLELSLDVDASGCDLGGKDRIVGLLP